MSPVMKAMPPSSTAKQWMWSQSGLDVSIHATRQQHPIERCRLTNPLNITDDKIFHIHSLTFTHDSVRRTVSSVGTAAGAALLNRLRPNVQCDAAIRGATCKGWFALRLFAKTDALEKKKNTELSDSAKHLEVTCLTYDCCRQLA